MENKKRIAYRRIAVIALAMLMMVCVFAMPAAAGQLSASPSDALISGNPAGHEHTYDEGWHIGEKPDAFLHLGTIERECSVCHEVETHRIVPSPLLALLLLVLAAVVIIEAVQLLAALAKKARKGFRMLLGILAGICLLILLIGSAWYSLKHGARFFGSFGEGLLQLLSGRGFYAQKESECIFMVFGSTGCKIVNGLFYLSLLTLIFALIALIKGAISGVKKGAKAVGDTMVETKDHILGDD